MDSWKDSPATHLATYLTEMLWKNLGGCKKKDQSYLYVMSGLWGGLERLGILFDVLHLFPNLLNQHFQLNTHLRQFSIRRF